MSVIFHSLVTQSSETVSSGFRSTQIGGAILPRPPTNSGVVSKKVVYDYKFVSECTYTLE